MKLTGIAFLACLALQPGTPPAPLQTAQALRDPVSPAARARLSPTAVVALEYASATERLGFFRAAGDSAIAAG